MPLIRATNKTGDGAQYVLNSGEDFLVGAGVTVQSNNALSIFCTSPGAHVMRIEGTISGYQGALLCGVQGVEGPAYIHIGKTGTLSSRFDVVNGFGIGLQARGTVLENHGVISAYNAVSLNAQASSFSYTLIVNAGAINATSAAFFRPTGIGANEPVRIVNSGTILTGAYVINFANAIGLVTFINNGTAQGDIVFGGSGGHYDGTFGLLLAAPGNTGPARISTTSGSLNVSPGRSAESFDFSNTSGGTVSFEKSPTGVRFSLDESLPMAGAVTEGDVYLGLNRVNNLTGSRQGDDWLRGREIQDFITGLGGNDYLLGDRTRYLGDSDTLLGGDGNDFLFGQGGRDVLSGGAGQDDFNLANEASSADQITDFNAEDDRLIAYAPDFGYPRTANSYFLPADDFRLTFGHHRAGDRSDRFIYDTKKTQLWFDPDGSGRKKAIMIADLQPGALLTAGDILLDFESF